MEIPSGCERLIELLASDKTVAATQIPTVYNRDEHKSISEHPLIKISQIKTGQTQSDMMNLDFC